MIQDRGTWFVLLLDTSQCQLYSSQCLNQECFRHNLGPTRASHCNIRVQIQRSALIHQHGLHMGGHLQDRSLWLDRRQHVKHTKMCCGISVPYILTTLDARMINNPTIWISAHATGNAILRINPSLCYITAGLNRFIQDDWWWHLCTAEGPRMTILKALATVEKVKCL